MQPIKKNHKLNGFIFEETISDKFNGKPITILVNDDLGEIIFDNPQPGVSITAFTITGVLKEFPINGDALETIYDCIDFLVEQNPYPWNL